MRIHSFANYGSFKATYSGEATLVGNIRPMAEKGASKSQAFSRIGTHIHKTKQNTKTQPLKRRFQQAFNYHFVCFSVTGSESELFFLAFSSLKENIPSPKYGIHLHCNPKWRANSFPLDLCFTYSHSLLFLMDNEWKHSPVGISMRTKPPSETDVLETKLPVTVRQIIHSYSHSGPNCAVLLHVHL